MTISAEEKLKDGNRRNRTQRSRNVLGWSLVFFLRCRIHFLGFSLGFSLHLYKNGRGGRAFLQGNQPNGGGRWNGGGVDGLSLDGKVLLCGEECFLVYIDFQTPQLLNTRMKDKNESEIMDVLHAKQPESRIYTQKFEHVNHEITHENQLEVQRTETQGEPLCIKNYFAYIEGDRVYKTTEIQLEDRLIKIIDSFSTLELHQNSTIQIVEEMISEPNCCHPQRTNLLNKRFRVFEDETRTRDTKNVVKNILRLFQSWIDDHSPPELGLKRALESLLDSGKFNNNLIINLSRDQLLRKAFLGFSEAQAQQMIGKSKIRDKQSHMQALHKYQRICHDECQQQEMKKDVRQEVLANGGGEMKGEVQESE